MKAEGIIQFEGLEPIENPTLEINSVFVEAIFIDGNGFKQSRLMSVDLTSLDLSAAMDSNETLKLFK